MRVYKKKVKNEKVDVHDKFACIGGGFNGSLRELRRRSDIVASREGVFKCDGGGSIE